MGDGTAVSEKGSGFGAEPKVRIHLPPAASLSLARTRFRALRTPAYRAGVRAWLGDRDKEFRLGTDPNGTRWETVRLS